MNAAHFSHADARARLALTGSTGNTIRHFLMSASPATALRAIPCSLRDNEASLEEPPASVARATAPASARRPIAPDPIAPDPIAPDALIGAVIGGLVIEGIVAEGGIGVVYLGRGARDGRGYAVKVLQARHADDAGIVSRFAREVAFGGRVAHPSVAALLGHGRLADGRPYFVMPLLEGCTLGALIRREGPLSLPRALAFADQILAGLEALHAARVVHRDLQPDNVFIARDASAGERAILIDLGFAQEPGVDTGDGVSPDSPGALVGTLMFMSPEQATRSRAITEQSDVFTAALLVYYALTRKLPFRGGSDLDTLVSIVRDAPIPLRKERRNAPARLDAILTRCLAKHPDARLRGAAEMRAALASLRDPR
jgi:eukaryotic-like serine/threonine-protein kinase